MLRSSIEYQIDTSAVEIPMLKARSFYGEAIGLVKGLTEKAKLQFPKEKINIFIHPFFNHERSRAEIKQRRDEVFITVPYQWIVEVKVGSGWQNIKNSPRKTLALFWHEIGHAIIRENAEFSRSALFSEYFQLTRKFQDVTLHAKKEMKKMDEEGLSESEMNIAIGKLKDDFFRAEKQHDALHDSDVGRILLGLEEYFADVVAVLVSGDPRAIVNAINIKVNGKSIPKTDETARDFKSKDNEIKKWKENSEDVHDFFSPARYFLFQKYLKHKDSFSDQNKAKVLRGVYEAILTTSSRLKKDDEIDLRTVNEYLIQDLQTHIEGMK